MSTAAKGMASLLRERSHELVEPLAGVAREAQIEDTQIMIDVAKELYAKAKDFTEGKTAPTRGSRFLGVGAGGIIVHTLNHFDEFAKDALFEAKRIEGDAPLVKFSRIVDGLAEGFEDLSGRLALSCSVDKKLI